MNVRFTPILLLASLIFSPAYSKVYQWTDEEGHTHFSDRPPPNTNGTRQVVPESEQSVLQPGSNGADLVLNIRELLAQHQFIELNHRLSSLDSAVSESIRYEETLLRAYSAFNVNDDSMESDFNQWVVATPDHYVPYLARALFHYRMGWKARGHAYASETSPDQLQGMRARFDSAKGDIHQALSLNNKPLLIYSLLVDIESTLGNDRAAKAMMHSGLGVHPLSFHIRSSYLRSLIPRWGGSYEEMSTYIQASQEKVSDNPRLQLLKGFVYADIGDMELLRDNYETAKQRYTQALNYGEYPDHYYQRAKVNYWQGDYDSALSDIENAIELESGRAIYHSWHSRILMKLGRLDESIDSIKLAFRLDPGEERVSDQKERLAHQLVGRGDEHSQAYDYQTAIRFYKEALELVPNDAETYYRLAWSHGNLHQVDLAVASVDKAIQLNPDNINYFVYADRMLARNKQWDKIISYWNIFIERHPDVSRAYFERGGTHYHNGDMDSALADLKTASDLGDPRASELYDRLSRN